MADGTQQGFSPRFFLPPEVGCAEGLLSPGDHLTLARDDSHHAARVLRLRSGDGCEVVTADGAVFRAAVVSAREPVELVVTEAVTGAAAGAVYHHEVGLVQALARPVVMDYVLEKGTEVGADFFLLVPAAGSPRHADVRPERLERWRRIAGEAAKQSKQTRVPRVDLVPSLTEAAGVTRQQGGLDVVLEPGAEAGLSHVLTQAVAGANAAAGVLRVFVWIGPEGGWESAELDTFRDAGATLARLGRSVLRTETAGPVAVAIARLALDDW